MEGSLPLPPPALFLLGKCGDPTFQDGIVIQSYEITRMAKGEKVKTANYRTLCGFGTGGGS